MGPKGKIIAGAEVVLVTPWNYIISYTYSLTKPCSNVAEYNVLLIGLQLAKEMGVKYLEAYGDSKVIVNQVRGEYGVHHEDNTMSSSNCTPCHQISRHVRGLQHQLYTLL